MSFKLMPLDIHQGPNNDNKLQEHITQRICKLSHSFLENFHKDMYIQNHSHTVVKQKLSPGVMP